MDKLQEKIQEQNDFIYNQYILNGRLTEFDQKLNDKTRAIIKAYKQKYKEAYLINWDKLDYYKIKASNVKKIYNFEYQIIAENEQTANYIIKESKKDLTAKLEVLDKILNKELNALFLEWV